MEHVEGQALDKILKEKGRLDAVECPRIAEEISHRTIAELFCHFQTQLFLYLEATVRAFQGKQKRIACLPGVLHSACTHYERRS